MEQHPLTDLDPMDSAAQEAAEILRLLSNPLRLRLMCALVPGDLTVSALVAATGARQATVSGELLKLRGEGLVACSRDGRQMVYRLEDPRVRPILECLYAVFCPDM